MRLPGARAVSPFVSRFFCWSVCSCLSSSLSPVLGRFLRLIFCYAGNEASVSPPSYPAASLSLMYSLLLVSLFRYCAGYWISPFGKRLVTFWLVSGLVRQGCTRW